MNVVLSYGLDVDSTAPLLRWLEKAEPSFEKWWNELDQEQLRIAACPDSPTETNNGPCIVCGCTTSDRTTSGGRSHWRRSDGEECAVRRNRGKKRPRPEAEVRAEWQERQQAELARTRTPTPA